MTGPTAASMVLRDPTVDMAVHRDRPRRHRPRRPRLPLLRRRRGAQRHLRPPRPRRRRHGRGTGRGEAAGGRGGEGHRRPERRQRAHPEDGRLHRRPSTSATSPATPDHPLVREHIRLGQRAVVLEQGLNGDQIVIYDHGNQIPLIWTHLIPATLEGKALHNVENAMFTAAMAYALGLIARPDPHRAQDLRQHLLPVARPDERLRRARLPRDPRLRPQRGRGRRHGRSRRAAEAARASASSASPAPATAATRTCRAIARKVAGKFDTYICHATTTRAAAPPTRCPR